MKRSNLETLRAIKVVGDSAQGRVGELKAETTLSPRQLQYCLKELWANGLIERSLTEIRLTDKGQAVVMQFEGLVPFTCSRCGHVIVVEEDRAKDLLGGHCLLCAAEFEKEPLYLPPEGLLYPAPEGMPPTRKNLRGQVVYTFSSYVDGKGRRRCGARTRRGEPCQRYAMEGSKAGRCPKHGGRAAKGAKASKTGRYSDYLGTLKDKFDQLATDPQLLNLRDEVTLLRTRIADQPDMPIRSLAYTIDTLAKTVQKIIEREEGIRHVVTIEELDLLTTSAAGLIRRTISRCPECGASLEPLLEEIAIAFKEHVKFLEAGKKENRKK